MSIFSINDNSNYGSILSQSKANKESKENSKISFANAFLKQNASKLNEIGIHFLVGLGVNVGLGWIDYDCLFLLARMNVILEINFLSRYVV
nr:hypothetical protein [Campylobacter coli]